MCRDGVPLRRGQYTTSLRPQPAPWAVSLCALVLLGAAARPALGAPCNPKSRSLLGGIKCEEAESDDWYQIEVYFGCAPRSGGAQALLEVKERRTGGKVWSRRTLKQSQIQSFILEQLGKGHREPPLFTSVLPGGSAKDKDVCGEQTRQPLEELTCGEGPHRAALRLDLMCLKTMMLPVPNLVLMDTSTSKPSQRKTIDAQRAVSSTYQHVGQKRMPLWSGRLAHGAEGVVEAMLTPKGGVFQHVEMKITPKEGAPCNEIVDVGPLWTTTWPPIPRQGFIEAAGIPHEAFGINSLRLTISPLKGPACEKVLDISEAWSRTWD